MKGAHGLNATALVVGAVHVWSLSQRNVGTKKGRRNQARACTNVRVNMNGPWVWETTISNYGKTM